MITLVFGHLADYAAPGAGNKLTLVGIFDRVFILDPTQPAHIPPCYLAAKFEASLMDGSEHDIEVRLVDGNGTPLTGEHPVVHARFATVGPGYPLSATMIMQLMGLPLPTVGDYAIELRSGGASSATFPSSRRLPRCHSGELAEAPGSHGK